MTRSYCHSRRGGRKPTYRSEAKARRAIRLSRGGRPSQLTGRELFAYQCPTCGGWHLSSTPPRSKETR